VPHRRPWHNEQVHHITDWVIDCDTHISEPAGVWTDRLPAKWRDLGPRMVRTERGVDAWLIGDEAQPIPVGLTAVAGWPEPFPSAPKTMDEVPAAAYDARARLDYMDSVGIWAMALYPNVGGFGNQAFLKLGDPELMLACVRAYNDWLVEWCEPDPRRFIPIMATPFWDIDATVDEIERCVALGHKGILFSGEPQTLGQPLLGDRYWDPLYRIAAETHMSLNFHIGSGDMSAAFERDRVRAHGLGSTLVNTSINLFLGNALQVTDLLLSGVLPRHPDVQFVSVESGIGWVPFVLESADYCFEYSTMRTDRPEFEMRPSEYFHRQVFACSFFESHAPRRDLDMIGADNVLFETDYPHPVCLYGNVREKLDDAFSDLDAPTRRKVLWDNAAKLYGVTEPDRPWEPVPA
jgi:predicted TIM-barrel fold metal-dependent hydrolase